MVDSASNRNEYQEYFLVVKAASAWDFQPYQIYKRIVLKAGIFSILEHSRSVHACNGFALPD